MYSRQSLAHAYISVRMIAVPHTGKPPRPCLNIKTVFHGWGISIINKLIGNLHTGKTAC